MCDERLNELALSAGRGDSAALEEFVRSTHRDVWRFCAHLTDVQSADDLTQETFLRAMGSLPRFGGRSTARTWLLSIARRVVVDRYRNAAARPRCVDTGDWQRSIERASHTAAPDFGEELAIADLVDRLPRERREAFVVTQLFGWSYAETAISLGCPIGTVRSRVARAREVLVAQVLSCDDQQLAWAGA